MSCFPEATYSVYVDDELPTDEVHAVELHLVECRDCRAAVLALREEADLLGDAMHEAVREPVPRLAPAAPARGVALGLAPALALAVAASAVVGWLLENGLPAAVDFLNPLSLRGAFRMTLDLMFVARDQAPQVFQMAVAIAAMGSVSAVLTFAVNSLGRRGAELGALLLAVVALLAAPKSSQAHFGLHEHEDLVIAAGETHDGALISWAQDLSVDGVVEGDLIAFSKRVVVRGEVRGNVIAVGESVEIRGRVTGSAHLGADRVSVSGEVGDNLYAAGENVSLSEAGRVGRDAVLGGKNVPIEGSVGRDLHVFTERAELRGSVARNLTARGERLVLLDGSRVGGDVDASLPSGKEIEQAAGAQVGGELRSSVRENRIEGPLERFKRPMFYAWLALHIAAGFLLGMLLHALVPRLFGQHLETAGAFFRSLGVGFLTLIAAPLAVALTAATLVGIPVALIGLGVFLSALFVSAVIVAAMIGSALVRPADEAWRNFGWSLIVGLIVLVVATHMPYVGGPLSLLAVLTGLGLLVEQARQAWLAPRAV